MITVKALNSHGMFSQCFLVPFPELGHLKYLSLFSEDEQRSEDIEKALEWVIKNRIFIFEMTNTFKHGDGNIATVICVQNVFSTPLSFK